jgi:type IV pilus assembly protein PilY1
MTTINLQVGASSDDARQNSGVVGLTGAGINAGGVNQQLGFRFTNVTVPNAATVTSAILSLYVTSTANDTPNGATVGMEAADNAGTFTTGANNITNRTRTSTTAWSGTDIGAGWQTVDVTSYVQTVVNRAGWVSGNAMAAILYGVTGSDVTITAWDGTPSQAAKLDITYTAGGVPAKAMMYYARRRRG